MSSRMPSLPQGMQLAAIGPAVTTEALASGGSSAPQLSGAANTGQLPQGRQDTAAQSAAAGGSISPMGNAAAVMGGGKEGAKVIFKSANDQPQFIEIDDASPTVEALRAQEVLNRTIQFIITKPDNATQILRSWVADGAN